MGSVNKVILVGNLGRDPEVRYTPNGTAVATFPLATHKVYVDKNGTKQKTTVWHRIVAWNKLGEICGQYLTKGKQVYIEGELVTRSFEGKDGKVRWITEVVAKTMQMLGTRNGEEEITETEEETPPDEIISPDGFDEEKDVPF